ncbi:Methionyl-tRNA formyltransferase [Varicellaria rhodocarpa]|nr:Methionyl-tRNA formyltransferase [Varicellaria rhodocarpa]
MICFCSTYGFTQSAIKFTTHTRRHASSKSSDPLRILFCGSDEFSIASLKALNEERIARLNFIKSIDVVCKPGKHVGRGLKIVREVPIIATARELLLPLHQINTFTQWQAPKPNGEDINLIIAVSFGLFVPPRILNGAKYGGLNVHPSILPDFRGPAPLHHTLLAGCHNTGISLQTLHPKQFDHGVVLAQTPLPGFDIPSPNEMTVQALLEMVAPKAAEMLIQGLKDRVYVPPLEQVIQSESKSEILTRTAKRIVSEDKHIDWTSWTSQQILTRHRVLGPLWNKAVSKPLVGAPQKRIIWASGFRVSPKRLENIPPGIAVTMVDHGDDYSIYIKTIDEQVLEAELGKIEGEQTGPAGLVARKAKLINNQIELGCKTNTRFLELV